MTTALQLRRGTTAQHSSFTGANGEVTVDTTKKTLVVHDGVTVGGYPLAKEADAINKVRFDTSGQGLTDAQKLNARTNIDAAKEPTTNGWIVRTGAGSSVSRALEAGAGISISNQDGTAGNPVITNTGVRSVNGQTGDVTIAVDTSNKVSKSGDTMTGPLVISTGGLYLYGWGGNANTGVVFLNQSCSRYLHFDGTNYVMPGANLVVNGAQVVTAAGGALSKSGGTISLNPITSPQSVSFINSSSNTAAGSLSIDAYGRITSVISPYNCNCTC